MPRLDLVLALIRAGSNADVDGVRAVVEAMANEEARRGRQGAAERIRGAATATVFKEPAAARTHAVDVPGLLDRLPARRGLDELSLEDGTRAALLALVNEQKRAGDLAAGGLVPRHKILLSGPPGNGKTSVAEALAHDLAVPFDVVSYGALVGSLLGETNRRIETLFSRAAAHPRVMLFDEFEAVGKERADTQETGEMKRALASLLTRLDTLPPSVVVVAATNHPEMLDRAVWRRFEIKLVLNPPIPVRAADFLAGQIGLQPGPAAMRLLGQCFPSSTYAELKDFALDVRRRSLLAPVETAEALRQEMVLRFPDIDWPRDGYRPDQAAAPPGPAKKRGKDTGKAARRTVQHPVLEV